MKVVLSNNQVLLPLHPSLVVYLALILDRTTEMAVSTSRTSSTSSTSMTAAMTAVTVTMMTTI
jgi:hypothetical protein